MAQIELQQLQKDYAGQAVIRGVDLQVLDGELMVFVGPSGCGKSTLLRMIAGLESVSAGQILLDGQCVNEVAPADRGAAMVFQSYALYPHMTVAENMGFALRMSGQGKSERTRTVAEVADKLQLTDLLHRYPRQLSGGQRQRVAIGRAIVRRPKVFLFDEPLSNLDAALRVQMRIELARLHAELGTTMVYVTHDQTEAMTLGHRIAVIHQGRIEQVGPPMQLYERPANRFVAEFLGAPKLNVLPCRWEAAGRVLGLGDQGHAGTIALDPSLYPAASQAVHVGLRPEFIALRPGPSTWTGTVEFLENLGDQRVVYVRVQGLEEWVRVKMRPDEVPIAKGDPVGLHPDPARLLLFRADGTCLHSH